MQSILTHKNIATQFKNGFNTLYMLFSIKFDSAKSVKSRKLITLRVRSIYIFSRIAAAYCFPSVLSVRAIAPKWRGVSLKNPFKICINWQRVKSV